MLDYSCIADISPEFGEFCIKNGGVIAQRIGKFLPACLLFGSALDKAREGGGSMGAL